MRLLLILSILQIFSGRSIAQKNGIVKGVSYDSVNSQFVSGATITILRKKDSSLMSFSMTDQKGGFELSGLANGEYRLMLTHINYHNLNRHFSIGEESKTVDLGRLPLKDLAQVLSEVTVTAEAPPVTLVGDTIQYNASSFKTPPNANVEQLLKNMPGIKVDKDGSITAQGQKVSRLLVDGKEFFGNDPKIATRNLPADAVEKVQSYDRLSDAAQLTGIDDGNSEKTLNLKLKKDKKKGMFGKITAGGGTNDRYEGRFNLNSFKAARQLSAIGMANNTNSEGFSFMDLMSFSGELNRMRQGGGGGGIILTTSDGGGQGGMGGSNSTGLNTIRGGGINYNNLIGTSTDFTSNLFYNHYAPLRESEVERQYLLPDSSYLYNQRSTNLNKNNSYRLNLGADIRLDSFHSIKISPSFGYQRTDNINSSTYQTMSNGLLVSNEGFSNTGSKSDGFNFRNEILFRKKFRQKGRTFSLSLQTSLNQTGGEGSMNSMNNFFSKAGTAIGSDTINQFNTNSADLWSYNLRGVYTEPIMRNALLEISLGRSNSVSNAEKTTFDFNKATAKYDRLNPLLTNDFTNTYGYTNAGFKLRAIRSGFNISAGVNAQQADLEGKVIAGTKDSVIIQRFRNLLPNARVQYNFTKFRNLTLNYNTTTNQPTMAQLQPVPDISDPLNIRAGNPDLKQEYSHSVQLNLVSVNPFKNKNMFVFITFSQTANKIVNNDLIDNFGVKTTTPVNIDGVKSVSGRASIGLPLKFLRGSVNLSSDLNYNSGKQFINSVANEITNLNFGPQLRLDLNFSSKFFMTAGAEIRYSNTSYSLASARDARFIIQEYSTEINWEIPFGFFLNTNYTYTINAQQADGFNIRFPLWNASLSKQFLKYKRGELKLTAFDLMNKNIGISRTANQNFIEDKRVNNLQRFFMLGFTYSLSKNSASAGSRRDAIMIR